MKCRWNIQKICSMILFLSMWLLMYIFASSSTAQIEITINGLYVGLCFTYLFFKMFFFMICTLLHALESFVMADFPYRLRYLQNRAFWTHLQRLLPINMVPTQFILDARKQKEVPNQDCTANNPLIRCFEFQLLYKMCESSYCVDEERPDGTC